MASPPNASSPSGMSPPGPSPASLPNKKRSSSTIDGNPSKRRKPSQTSASQPAHPLRQTSFPPPESNTNAIRSPSVDATSHVSGSQVSGYTANGTLKKKRGRKPKNAKAADADAASSQAGGSKGATSSVNGAGGDKDAEDEEEEDDQAEMAVEGGGAMTEAQIAEEHRVRAMLVDSFDPDQLYRYENWRAARLTEAVVKRVRHNSVRVFNRKMLINPEGRKRYSIPIRSRKRRSCRPNSHQGLCRRYH